jgi:hypothetical protein
MNQLRGANLRLLRQLYEGIESRSVEPIGLISEIWLTPWNTPSDRQA